QRAGALDECDRAAAGLAGGEGRPAAAWGAEGGRVSAVSFQLREHERLLLEEQHALVRVQRAAALWTLPALPETDVPAMTGLPLSTYYSVVANGKGPGGRFKIGRRAYVISASLRAWLEQQAKITAE